MTFNWRKRRVITAGYHHIVTKAGLRYTQTMVKHLVDIHRTERDLRTTGKAFHPVEERGNTVCLLDNHIGEFLIFLRQV